MTIKAEFRRVMRRMGYQPIVPTVQIVPDWLTRRMQVFQTCGIDLVLDVGANIGQYAQQLRREIHYKKKIISFEPLKREYSALQINSAADNLWEVHNIGLGDANERRQIHVAANSYSSSLLDMLPTHEDAAPESKYIEDQIIELRTLDSMFAELRGTAKEIYMKIDTQGFEGRVLKGSERSLQFINTIQMEMSLVPLYSGELLFDDLHQMMRRMGYQLIGVEPGFADRHTGRLLQLDGIYHR